MADYQVLRSNSWKLPGPNPESEEEQEVLEPTVNVVCNVHEERRESRTIAVTVSMYLPLNTSRCSHCDAAEQFANRSRTHHMKEA
jgi:hypothetical protein